MRIACVHAQIRLGGADRRLIDLANTLAERGETVFLYLMSEENYDGFWIHPDICQKVISTKSPIPKTQYISNTFALRKFLKKDRIDFAISFLYPINIQLLLAKNGLSVKTLISERGDPNQQPAGGIWQKLRDLTYPRTDAMVYQTQGAKQYYLDRIGLDGRVIHNPVDVGDAAYSPNGDHVIANIGLLEPHKNQRRLLYAFSLFVKDYPDYRLRICGGGVLEAELKAYAKDLGIFDRVLFMGKVPEAHRVISKDEFFVLSSDFEGMPNALMEAMAMGMPCISCDCVPGGARELICDGENGLLCALDDGEDLAEKMKRFAADPDLRARLGTEAAKLKDSHASKNIYDFWYDYINEVCKKGNSQK